MASSALSPGHPLDQILARRLQDGDPGGRMRRAIERFPFPKLADRVWQSYFLRGGKAGSAPYKRVPMPAQTCPRELLELIVLANLSR